MDFFINGQLVYTYSNILPCYDTDSITVGEDKGIQGGLCNFIYFNKPLNISNIYILYNSKKKRNPPI